MRAAVAGVAVAVALIALTLPAPTLANERHPTLGELEHEPPAIQTAPVRV